MLGLFNTFINTMSFLARLYEKLKATLKKNRTSSVVLLGVCSSAMWILLSKVYQEAATSS